MRERKFAPKTNNLHDFIYEMQCSSIPGLPIPCFGAHPEYNRLEVLEIHGIQTYPILIQQVLRDQIAASLGKRALRRLIISDVVLCNPPPKLHLSVPEYLKDPLLSLFHALSHIKGRHRPDLHIRMDRVGKAGWDGTISLTNDQIRQFMALQVPQHTGWLADLTAHLSLVYLIVSSLSACMVKTCKVSISWVGDLSA